MTRPGALPHPRRRRLVDRPARASRSTTPRPTGRCSRRSSSTSAPAPTASCMRLPLHINDEAFADALVAAWREVAAPRSAEKRQPSARTHAPHRPTDPARALPRQDRRRPAAHRRRRRHRPLGQVRGGRRHRPDRHLQLGPLPHGRARLAGRPARLRQRQRDRLRDGARGAAGGEAHAGAGRRQRHRPVHDPRAVPAAPDRPRLLRHPELPDRRPDRRHLPRQPRGDRHGLRPRGRADRARPRARPADHALRVQRGRTRATWPRPAPTSSSATSA